MAFQNSTSTLPLAAVPKKRTRKHTVGTYFGATGVGAVLVVYALIILYPLVWMIFSSFKSTNGIFQHPWGLPIKWDFANYVNAWKEGISQYFLNSVIVTGVTTVLVLMVSALAAYGLTKYRFRFQNIILMVIAGGMMFAPQVSVIPLFKLVQSLNIYNTYWALILPYVAYRLPLIVLLIRAYFMSIPHEYVESATIDGCSNLGILFRIYVPLSKPIFATAAILSAYYAWNEFMFANIFINNTSLKTIPSGLLAFQDALNTDWGGLLAGLTISALPLIVLFLFIQKQFVRGLAEGGVKG